MKEKICLGILGTVIVALLIGCSKEPPKCSDDSTIKLVRQIILNNMGGSEGLSEKEIQDNMKIEYPRASAFDEKIKKYSCEAKLIAGGAYELPITYESQIDDKGQHIVAVGGLRTGDLVILKAGIVEAIMKSRTTKSEATPQPQQPQPTQPSQPQPSAAVTWSPSFDCTKATTGSERLICSNKELSEADVQLVQAYRAALENTAEKDVLKRQQRDWLKNERDACSTVECMMKAYKDRMEKLSQR